MSYRPRRQPARRPARRQARPAPRRRRAPPRAKMARQQEKSWGLAPYVAKRFLSAALPVAANLAVGGAASSVLPYLIDKGIDGYSMINAASQAANYGKSLITGFGDYEIKKNVFLQGRLPEMMNIPSGGGTVIRFQEYLGDIVTSSSANTFNLQSFLINAGRDATFPWLSQIAANYEQYSFEGLVFEFRSTSADALNSTNTALGSVMMATNYDSADADFQTKSEMLNYEFSTSIKPSENCMHMVECEPNQTVLTELYTLAGDVPSGKDSRFYHLGNFQIATTGFQGTSVNVGELHVTYQVRLLKPKLFNSLGGEIEFAHWSNATSVANGTPLGTAGSETVLFDSIGIDFISSAAFELPAQNVSKRYMLWVLYGGTAAAVVAPNVTVTGAAISGFSSMSQTPASGVSSANMRFGTVFDTEGNGVVPNITFGTGGTLPTGSASIVIYLTQIPNDSA